MSSAARLSGVDVEGRPVEWQLTEDESLVGRDTSALVSLLVPRVSRRHALITRRDSYYYLSDLGSLNGTYVNGLPVDETAVRLKDGDEIVIAGIVALRFHNPSDTIQMPRLGRLQGIWIDEASRSVWIDGHQVDPPLSPAQFALLQLLYGSAGQVFSRSQIIAAVWADIPPATVSDEAVEGLIKRLRARLRETQPDGDYVQVVRGHGLRLIQPGN
jgi:pSer/pThr/pTyr-binding forkhead associated (FHA) protein